jgi:multimeric flavodoxin WrbA
MKVLLINGSPHKEGCTYTALKEVASTLQKEGIETEIAWIENKPIGGCIACGTCRKTGKCAFDDVVNRIKEKCEEADGFVFGTPVHYAAASGNMTAFMDRLFYTGTKTFYMKPAACVLSARRAGTTATFDQMNKYFFHQQMPIATSRYWNMVHGNTPEEVKQDEEGLQIMRYLGRNMAWLLKLKEAGDKNGVALPGQEETRLATNFIR